MKQYQFNAGARYCARERGAWQPALVSMTAGKFGPEFRNTLKQFVEQCCVVEAGAIVGADDLYRAYERWATTIGKRCVMKLSGFEGRMIAAGVRRERGCAGGKDVWIGLKLKQTTPGPRTQ